MHMYISSPAQDLPHMRSLNVGSAYLVCEHMM